MLDLKTFVDTVKDNLYNFVGEHNNALTRERIYNTLKTLLEYNKYIGDVYDYLIITNNDKPQFNIQIYIKPRLLDKFVYIGVTITESEIIINHNIE